jgi:hypothetical protein
MVIFYNKDNYMNKEYAILSFTIHSTDDFENREASQIDLTVPADMTIWEYRTMCKRLASAIGYTNKSIESAFPHIEVDNDEKNDYITEYLKSIIKKENK